MTKRRITALWLVLLVVVPLEGCARGTEPPPLSGKETPIIPDLRVLHTLPVEAAASVEIQPTLSVTFSEGVHAPDVTTTSFTLRGEVGCVSGSVEVSGDVASFRPDKRLPLLGQHTASVSAGIHGLSGGTLKQEHSWNFTVRDGTWRGGRFLHHRGGGATVDPQVVVLGDGSALALWSESEEEAPRRLRFSRYVPSEGWAAAEEVDATLSGGAYWPRLVAGADGSALAVWVHQQAQSMVFSSRYMPGKGWEPAQAIDSAMGDVTIVHLEGNSRGAAVAVWTQFNVETFGDDVWAAHYEPGSGWSSSQFIEADAFGYTFEPRVALDDAGHAWAVWERFDFETNTGGVWAREYVPGQGWQPAVRMDKGSNQARSPQVLTLDVGGTTFFFWLRFEGWRYALQSQRYVPSQGWESIHTVDLATGGHSISPQATLLAGGRALLVWSQYDGSRNSIMGNSYVPGKGWGSALLIESYEGGIAFGPQLAMDARGHAVAVWEQEDGERMRVGANRYVENQGWGTASVIDTDCPGSGANPQVAMNTDGSAVALWQHTSSGGAVTGLCFNVFD